VASILAVPWNRRNYFFVSGGRTRPRPASACTGDRATARRPRGGCRRCRRRCAMRRRSGVPVLLGRFIHLPPVRRSSNISALSRSRPGASSLPAGGLGLLRRQIRYKPRPDGIKSDSILRNIRKSSGPSTKSI
jgi:hypothetical protein